MKRYITALAAIVLIAASASAQTFQQSLFLDGYRLGFRYNPAIQNGDGFLSVGQFENQRRSNFGAASFLYPRGDEVVTALHSSVSAGEFLGSLNDDNYINGNINYNLVSYGWRKDNVFHTLEANVRAIYFANVPKEIFSIMKLGTGEKKYDLGGMSLGGNAIVELAYGYSSKVSDIISVGIRAKLLIGIEALRYNVSRFDMSLSEEVYQADVEADLDLTSRWRKIVPDQDGYLNLKSLSAKERWRMPSGAGLAIDMGLVITPLEGLTIAASALDLGGMLWYYGNAGKSMGTTTFTGMENLTLDDIKAKNISSQFDGALDAFMRSIKIKPADSKTSLEAIPFNLNLGVKYEMPFYRALSVGATGNFISMKGMSYNEVRGALAWNPCSYFGMTAGGGVGTYGPVWNFALNAGVKNFRLTVGLSDGFGGKIPYTGTDLKANNKVLTAGLTYDL